MAAGSITRNESGPPFDRNVRLDVLIRSYPQTKSVLDAHGLFCFGCLLAPFHDIHDAAAEHEVDEDDLYHDLLAAADRPMSE